MSATRYRKAPILFDAKKVELEEFARSIGEYWIIKEMDRPPTTWIRQHNFDLLGFSWGCVSGLVARGKT